MEQVEIRNGYALFWGQWPSNWMISPMVIDGVTYNCVEQYMMAEKARLFKDTETLAKILETQHPADQKILGREVRGYDDAKWAAVRYGVVLRASIEKYRQNYELKRLLFATGDAIFVEASPKDQIWGIGMARSHPDATNPAKWRGENLLGKAITEARKILRDLEGSV